MLKIQSVPMQLFRFDRARDSRSRTRSGITRKGNCVTKRKLELKKKLKSKESKAIKIGFPFLLFMKSSLPSVNHVLLLCFLHSTLTATHNPPAKTDWASKIVRFGEGRFEEASLSSTNT